MTWPSTWEEAKKRLAEAIGPGFEEREEQDSLVEWVSGIIEDGGIFVGQAGTGAGKSFGTLVPAIMSGKRVIYATGTKALQDQIVSKDLPLLAEHVFPDLSYAVMYGRSNYVCHARLSEVGSTASGEVVATFAENPGHSGLRSDFDFEFSDEDWRSITTTTENCPGTGACSFGKECRQGQALIKARQAQVVVANHSLVCLDGKMGGAIVGPADALIVDEVHELEEYATSAFTHRITEGTFRHMAQNLVPRFNDLMIEPDGALALQARLLDAAKTLFDSLPEGRLRQAWIVENSTPFENALFVLLDILSAIDVADHDVLLQMGTRVEARFSLWKKSVVSVAEALRELLMAPDHELVRRVEDDQQRKIRALITCPVSVASFLSESMWPRFGSSVLVSATSLVDGSADYLASRLGLSDYCYTDVGTPFDFASQSMLYVPSHIMDPSPRNRSVWEGQMVHEIKELLAASRGRALVLFTSYRQMKQVYDEVRRGLDFPVRCQGEAPLPSLTKWFREDTHGCLFGTRSLFTGLDVQGESLSLVIIDKLPFPVPTDPIFEARSEKVEADGGSSFKDLSIPMMSLPLQQAFGRLIRTRDDRGVVAILDPRLVTKGYGRSIRNSLPPATFTTSILDVVDFFQSA